MLTKTQLAVIAMATMQLCFPARSEAQSTNNPYNRTVVSGGFSNRTMTQDAKSGNTYDTITEKDGSTVTVGVNQRTGAIWKTYVQPNGDQSGTDANGNLWQNKSGYAR